MAAKRTHELIPFCHPLGRSSAATSRSAWQATTRCAIDARGCDHHRTGVEMEALTGASVAALTVYDMCKALSHDIVIESLRLVEKSGGKSDFAAGPAR